MWWGVGGVSGQQGNLAYFSLTKKHLEKELDEEKNNERKKKQT